EEAVKFVVPEKRSSGPLSAIAIRNFYSNLVEPLTLIDVAPTRPDEYRVRYTYVAPSRGRCDGEALVRTTKVDGLNLIDSIKAIRGCGGFVLGGGLVDVRVFTDRPAGDGVLPEAPFPEQPRQDHGALLQPITAVGTLRQTLAFRLSAFDA